MGWLEVVARGLYLARHLFTLFYSWRNIVCDGDGDWIRNIHHGKLHVSLTSDLPGFHPALTSYNETLNIRVSGCQL